MKKLLLGSAALLIFSCSLIVFQISCRKEAKAQTPLSGTNKILYSKRAFGNFDYAFEYWIADYDGSNATRIPLNVPGWRVTSVKLSPDATKIIFDAMDSTLLATGNGSEIFSADIDGANVRQVTHDNGSGKSANVWDVK